MPRVRPIRVVDYAHRYRMILALIILAFCAVGLAVSNWSNFNQYMYSYDQREETRKAVEASRATVQRLEWEYEQWKLGTFEVEKDFRKLDFLVRPDENLIRLRRTDRPSTTPAPRDSKDQ